MVDDGDITDDIQDLFLKILRNSTNITISLNEVNAELDKIIIGEQKNPHVLDTHYLKFKETKPIEYTKIMHVFENKFFTILSTTNK